MKLKEALKLLNENSTGTLLHENVWWGTLNPVTEALRAAGDEFSIGDFLITNNRGQTPLHWGACTGHLDQVITALPACGEKLSLKHFLVKDHSGYTPFHSAVQTGHLDQMVGILKASGETIPWESFLIKDDMDRTPLSETFGPGRLGEVFTPSLWMGRVGDMMKLWQHVPKEHHEDIPFDALRNEALQLSIESAPRMDMKAFSEAIRATVAPLPTPSFPTASDSLTRR